jgi:hypothetical protein
MPDDREYLGLIIGTVSTSSVEIVKGEDGDSTDKEEEFLGQIDTPMLPLIVRGYRW